MNMSLMFLRPLNSGINLPDSGSMSLTVCFRSLVPFSNIPGGLRMSITFVSVESIITLSLSTAYTGQ